MAALKRQNGTGITVRTRRCHSHGQGRSTTPASRDRAAVTSTAKSENGVQLRISAIQRVPVLLETIGDSPEHRGDPEVDGDELAAEQWPSVKCPMLTVR